MRFLIIEDEPEQRRLISRELQQEFPDAETVDITDRASFRQVLESGNFDLAVTEYQLHWGDGLEIVRSLKNCYPDRPIVMFTNTGDQEVAVEAMKSGLDDYILKAPKYYPRLRATVRATLERATEQRRTVLLEGRSREEVQQYAKQLEQAIHRHTQECEAASRDLETFVYSISHDLREPLRAIQSYTHILLEDHLDQLDSEGVICTQRIADNAARMNTLIQDLLTYSRLGQTTLSFQTVDLNHLLQGILNQMELEFQLHQAQVMVNEPLPMVKGHEATLLQVIVNLITNAIKFARSDAQPCVRIWAEEVGSDGEVREATLAAPAFSSKRVRLWVEDNGIGIDPQYHDRIFQVFERLHSLETYPGTGIGLAIVRKGIERLGGQVGLESELGQGSRFWIELPGVELP
jgi:signal transduction histidine kinase